MTSRQASLLAFLRQRELAGDLSPTFAEMMAHLGCRSKSEVHRILTALEERGEIRRMPNRARAIQTVNNTNYFRGFRDGYAAKAAERAGRAA